VLGGGGTNGPTNTYGTDTTDDEPQAKVITTRNAVVGSEAIGFVKDGADSVEDAPWSAAINPTDAYGYSIFDVDPGARPGETTITFQYFAIPAVSNEAAAPTTAPPRCRRSPPRSSSSAAGWAGRAARNAVKGRR